MDVTNTSWVQARAAFALKSSGGYRCDAAPTLNPTTRANQSLANTTTNELIAGSVHQPPHFAGAAATRQLSTGQLQLYTRPADRNEAAVGVALGKCVDLRA